MTKPVATVRLTFKDSRAVEHVDDPIHHDLSAAARCGASLFLSCDEAAGVDRLTPDGDGWGNHTHFNLGKLVDLPGEQDGEMDIEGLHCDGAWLWVCGSHALKRGKPKPHKRGPADALEELVEIDRDPNRYFLGRFPLAQRKGGLAPVAKDGHRRAAWIKQKKKKPKLKKWLRKDPRLGPFLDLPCKENGLDIEGIAAEDLRAWIGLRGPVLRDCGVILEMEFKVTKSGHLKPKKIDGDRRYRTHVLPMRGQGVRELSIDGDDLLVMAGPTMAGDGRCDIFRWPGFRDCRTSAVYREDQIADVLELPYRGARDHPEGLVAWPESDGWLVAYDSPAPERLDEKAHSITLDVWKIPRARGASSN